MSASATPGPATATVGSRGPAIRVQGVTKSFKDLHVLRGVDFEVERGSIFALLGDRDVLRGHATPARRRDEPDRRPTDHLPRRATTGLDPQARVEVWRTVKDLAVLGDTGALTGRSLRHILRSPDTIITMPGGIFPRFQSMPVARSSVLWAHVLTCVVANLVSVAVVVGVAPLMGFRTDASVVTWLVVAGILVLVTLALTWLAAIASAFSYPSIFLPFISSAFAPTAPMPGPVAWFADHQAVTSIVNTVRALFTGDPVGGEIWVALATTTDLPNQAGCDHD